MINFGDQIVPTPQYIKVIDLPYHSTFLNRPTYLFSVYPFILNNKFQQKLDKKWELTIKNNQKLDKKNQND